MIKNNICCVNVGERYHDDYVNILYNSCKRFSNLNFNFYCFTDRKRKLYPEIITFDVPIKDLEYGWWYKLYALSYDKFYEEKNLNLYLDLDVVIINSIDKFFIESEYLYMIKDWIWYDKEKIYNSSVISWNSCFIDLKNIWNIFIKEEKNILDDYHGDQEFLSCFFNKKIKGYNEFWCKSFKEVFVNKTDFLNEDTSIIVFHGFPKPHDLIFNNFDEKNLQPWIRNIWR